MFLKTCRAAILCTLVSFSIISNAQSVIIGNNIKLPADSVIKNQLINSLNGFLGDKEKPNKENSYVLKADLLETSDLLDEMKGIEQNNKLKISDFYKCYLTNALELDSNNFIVQLSYIGVKGNTPTLNASFKLLAKRQGNKFYFNSPLKQNTIGWRSKKLGTLTCYYKDTLTITAVKNYQKTVLFYDRKLNGPTYPIEFYYCESFLEVQQLLGIEYKADYNGVRYNSLTSHENNLNLIINGNDYSWQRFNAHDLWHERLRLVMNAAIINRPVDEGCAYLYGGSWDYTWPQVLAKFKKYAADNPNADWLNLYIANTGFLDGSKPLIISYALNALIVHKIESEKGFAPVMELLSCGHREKGDENYFKTLEKITGITKANFNSSMWDLIRNAQ